MRFKNKTFIVERRSGSHGAKITGDVNDWRTPRHMYFLTCMMAPLPAPLDNHGKADTLLKLTVTDDVNAARERLESVAIRLLLSGLGPAKEPAAKGAAQRIEVRINNGLLDKPAAAAGWLIFPVRPEQVALGENLVGVRVTGRPKDAPGRIRIEKLELEVKYRQ